MNTMSGFSRQGIDYYHEDKMRNEFPNRQI